MGRISMPVDIFEILALAWDHPLLAGLLMLMFTPPFFPVLVFFSPLLISTTLCAIALISVGQQIEDASKREREVAGWNARGAVDGDSPTVRERTSRRRRAPGGDNWLDWVRGGLEPGSVWGQTESSMFIEDVKEERLLADFRVDEGGIDMKEEDFRPQVEAFREFENRNLGERSFSFGTGAKVAATIDALELPDGDSSMRMVPFQNTSAHVQLPSPQIPPMFLYTLKTGGTGTGAGNGNIREALSSGPRLPHRQQEKTLVSFGNGSLSGRFEEPEMGIQPQPHPEQQQKTLVSFGSGFFSGIVEEPQKENERRQQPQQQQQNMLRGDIVPRSLEEAKDSQRQQQGELLSLGRGLQEAENVNHHRQHQHQRSTSPEIHVSSAESAHSTSVAKSSLSSHKSYGDNRESEHRKTSIFDFGGDSRDSKPRPSQERLKALTYNASLIPGNAVIYTAEPPPMDNKQLQRRNSLSNRDQTGSSTSSRQKRRHGMAARHALLMEKENNLTGNWMLTTTTSTTTAHVAR